MHWRARPIEKVYWRIGDIAKELDIATSAIRYWEAEYPEELSPKRRTSNGIRLYNIDEYVKVKEVGKLMATGVYTVYGAVEMVKLKDNFMILRLERKDDTVNMPKYHSKGAACFDIEAYENVEIPPGKTVIIDTGLKMEIPEGYEVEIRPRSGMSLKTMLRIPNSPGTIDSDYRGWVGVIMENIGINNIVILKGERIAQAKFQKADQVQMVFVSNVMKTSRGEGGFGSSGK